MSELAVAAVRRVDRFAPARRAAVGEVRAFRAQLRRAGVPRRPRAAGDPVGRAPRSRVPGAAAADPRSAARPLRPRRSAGPRCSTRRASRSSAPAPAPPTARQSRASSARGLAGRAWWSCRGSPAASTAPRIAARSRRGRTVAVLGCGIDRDYPRATRARGGIAERGLIVSEYPPGVEPAPWRFPARNRIVAGLCARDRRRRGARAQRCADHRRPRARRGPRGARRPRRDHVRCSRAGRTHLLRLGATPVTGADDVLAVARHRARAVDAAAIEPRPSASGQRSPTRRSRSTSRPATGLRWGRRGGAGGARAGRRSS